MKAIRYVVELHWTEMGGRTKHRVFSAPARAEAMLRAAAWSSSHLPQGQVKQIVDAGTRWSDG